MLPELAREFEESHADPNEGKNNQVQIDLQGKTITSGQAENKVPPKTEVKANPQKPIDFSKMDKKALSQIDKSTLNDKQKTAMRDRFKKLGY